jgi:hypothetical protein
MNKVIPAALVATALIAGCATRPDVSEKPAPEKIPQLACLVVGTGGISTTFCVEADPTSIKEPCVREVLKSQRDVLEQALKTGSINCPKASDADAQFWSCAYGDMGISPDSTAVVTAQGLDGDPNSNQILFMGTMKEMQAFSDQEMASVCPTPSPR